MIVKLQSSLLTRKSESATSPQVPEPAVIENDVPEPVRCYVFSYGTEIDLRATIKALRPGQSFVVDGSAARRKALDMGYALEIYVKTRKLEGKDQFRIWRKTN